MLQRLLLDPLINALVRLLCRHLLEEPKIWESLKCFAKSFHQPSYF